MKFSDPFMLLLLWGLVPVAGLLVYGIRQRKKILETYVDPDLFPMVLPGFSLGPRWARAGIILVALGLGVLALAGPQAGFRWEKISQKGVDIMVGLDCSRSMLAQDIKPTRLDRAKREIVDLTRIMTSDRAGLVAFSGQAVLQCPLTLDYDAFHIFLKVLTPDYLPVGGTRLASALRACVQGFDLNSDTDKAIILITDGEDTDDRDDLFDTARSLAEKGIKIFTIGVGDPSGAPVPDAQGGFKKDGQGNIILSRVNETTLKKLADMTGGRYVRSVAGDMDLEQIYTRDILNAMDRKALVQGKKKVWEQRFQWLLLPCVLLLILEGVIPRVKNKRRPARSAVLAWAMILVLPALVPGNARAGLFSSHVAQGIAAFEAGNPEQAKKHFIDAQLDNPDDLRLYFNIGVAAYASRDYGLAESHFVQAARSEDPGLRQKALYNLANTRYRLGKLDQAITDYQTLLKSFPDDTQARENLEFVKNKQEEEKSKQKNQGQQCQNPNDPAKDQDSKDQDAKDQDAKDQDGKDRSQDSPNQNNQGQDNQGQDNQGQKKSDPKDPGPNDSNQGQDDQNAREASGRQGEKPRNQPAQAGQTPDHAGTGQQTSKELPSQAGENGADADARNNRVDAESQVLETRLNRLTDQPGQGLVPVGRAQAPEKDW